MQKSTISVISNNSHLLELLSQHEILSYDVVFKLIDGSKKEVQPSDIYVVKDESLVASVKGVSTTKLIFLYDTGKSEDNVLVQPFSLADLFEMLQSVLEKMAKSKNDNIKMGEYLFNLKKSHLIVNDKEIVLTDTEAQIIAMLYNRADKFVKRCELVEKVLGYSKNVDTRAIESHIYRLRQKIGVDDFIITQDEGYILNP